MEIAFVINVLQQHFNIKFRKCNFKKGPIHNS